MEAYPFMWAKNKQISDWCCVAQPEFLRTLPSKAQTVLLGAQRGVRLAPGEIEIVRREYPGAGVLDIAYRKVPSGLTDRSGRSFDFIEGIVLRQRDPNLAFTASHFDDARAAIEQKYRTFTTATRWGDAEAFHQEAITLHANAGEPALKIREVVFATPNETSILPLLRTDERPATERKPRGEDYGLQHSRGAPEAPSDYLAKLRKSGLYDTRKAEDQIQGSNFQTASNQNDSSIKEKEVGKTLNIPFLLGITIIILLIGLLTTYFLVRS